MTSRRLDPSVPHVWMKTPNDSRFPAPAHLSQVEGAGLDEILVWSPRSEILKRAQSTGGSPATLNTT